VDYDAYLRLIRPQCRVKFLLVCSRLDIASGRDYIGFVAREISTSGGHGRQSGPRLALAWVRLLERDGGSGWRFETRPSMLDVDAGSALH
jgi:hypothetical protein